jgi:hypothetical protein
MMGNLLRRLRGAIGMGFAWAVALGLVGGVPRWVFGLNTDVPLGLVFGVFGFVSGVVFSVILVLTERRRTFEQMSLPRFAGWGALGGLAVAAFWTRLMSFGPADVMLIVPTFTAAVAACASGTLMLARRVERRELPSGG